VSGAAGHSTDARHRTSTSANDRPLFIQGTSKNEATFVGESRSGACGARMSTVDVLLVEDDPSIASSLCDSLRAAGHGVTHVSTGHAAVSADHGDLILLDLGLPDMDGYDVCRQIRAVSQVPIIVITARGEELDRVLGLELGADDYVVKPSGSASSSRECERSSAVLLLHRWLGDRTARTPTRSWPVRSGSIAAAIARSSGTVRTPSSWP